MKIAIIGAGCSGITAIKTLAEAGLRDVVCFEKNDRIGGNWVFTASESHSSVAETTHLISSKKMSQYSDFPMPGDYPDYPSHRQVLAYFEAYARHFGVERYIRFGISVLRAEKTVGDRWSLTLSDGSSADFDCLLVANGHHSVPRHPEWKEDFSGEYLHAHDFKNNRSVAGKRVLVVGAGNSGCDCAVESSRVASSVDLSVRTPQYIVPKLFMGRPTDTFAAAMQWLPQSVQGVLHRLSLRIQVGRYSDYGLPEPDFPPTKAHPTVNSELLEKIRHGMIRPRPGVARVEGRTVHFADGSAAEYDAIVAATGYKIHFPFFDPGVVSWEDATSIPLYLRVFHPQHPTLFFIGLVQPQGCVWPLSEAQSRLVARVVLGTKKLPADWRDLAVAEGAAAERTFLKNPRHSVEVHFLPYLKKLAR
ncbi:MAG: NAD(P)-binding domain-containing protein [Saprospiraceae bacterium]